MKEIPGLIRGFLFTSSTGHNNLIYVILYVGKLFRDRNSQITFHPSCETPHIVNGFSFRFFSSFPYP